MSDGRLKPCRECGAPCQVEDFAPTGHMVTIWICSNHKMFGGKCPSDTAYLTEEAWNDTSPAMTQHQAVDEGVSEAMIEAGVAEMGGRRTSGEAVEAIYLAMRALDPVLADMREALLAARNQLVVYHRTQFPEGTPLPQVIEGIDAALSRSERKD